MDEGAHKAKEYLEGKKGALLCFKTGKLGNINVSNLQKGTHNSKIVYSRGFQTVCWDPKLDCRNIKMSLQFTVGYIGDFLVCFHI